MELLCKLDGARPGAENMAIDRGLLKAYGEGELSSPLLRIYAWHPAAISLGYHQPESSIDLAKATAHGLDVVRRPTGGAAVLHGQEWTYALAGPLGLPGLGGGFKQIYQSVADAFVQALGELGIEAHTGGGGSPEGFVCFEALGGHEIAVSGRKLVGSAFRRGRTAFVQHGSLLLGPRHLDIVDYLSEGMDESARAARKSKLAATTIHLAELGRGDLSGGDLSKALAGALASRIGAGCRWLEALPLAVDSP